ncbi:zinc finger protein 37 [Stylonychia lemnae]|uniref:Zinc finger protein 37 n=1 Tax=Stylonychia lemnae TaxID=5949 RepID=A0A078B169_STYLE|nr:zinc finger protein 37 [Stylonychia lemnae]|eukprot:CDW87102.1 zinc finger protein 37 [Stylonychia lemnae]
MQIIHRNIRSTDCEHGIRKALLIQLKASQILSNQINFKLKPYNCLLCKKQYYRHYQLVKHTQNKHPYQQNIENLMRVKMVSKQDRIQVQNHFTNENITDLKNEQILSISEKDRTKMQALGLQNKVQCKERVFASNDQSSMIDSNGQNSNETYIASENIFGSCLNSPFQSRSTEELDCSPSRYLISQQDQYLEDSLSLDHFIEYQDSNTSIQLLPQYYGSQIFD